MAYIPNIMPYFETVIYLTYRFSDRRASHSLPSLQKRMADMPNSEWAYFEKIVELENDLDAEFKDNEMINYYFTPMKTKEDVAGHYPVSPGRLLLTLPDELDYDCSFDDICVFYKNASVRDKLEHFCDIYSLDSFYQTAEKSTSILEFMQVVDDILVEPKDKWKLIDVVANPLKHLNQLRGIAEAITKFITTRIDKFEHLAENLKKEFDSLNTAGSFLHKINIEMPEENEENAIYVPCLILLNGIFFRTYNGVPQIFIGAMFPEIIKHNSKSENIKNHADLLKALSDTTRLKALCLIRDRYSFGQELSEEVGGSRNAMYYHLEKLYGMGLITMRETEYRTLYTMNKKAVYEKLTALRDFLVGGWTPEDGEAEPEGGGDEPPTES